MVRLREIPRTATFAWSPGSAPPLIATGTRAGAVDADFSNETLLELWDLGLDNVGQGTELEPVGSISTDSRFYDIAWSQATSDKPRGIIAGALESGSLDLWDAEKLGSSPADSLISRTSKHSGAIKALQFNHTRHELLATAGAKGELYISDLNNIGSPYRLGASAARADDYECIDWNKGGKVPHILATGSSGGFVTVWDVRQKKENLTLNNFGRKPVSAVAWDPDVATRLITAIPNDQDPLILMWDLRNSNAPERILKGHELGVLSLDWCHQDSNLLLSCGKDNRTIAWNPHTGEAYGDYPVVTNWTFQTRFNPHNPSLLATASFDGKISVQTIQNTNPQSDEQSNAAAGQALDSEDFFAKAQTQPQTVNFSLPKAPKWMERPVGVSFAFGGKLVRLGTDAATRKSKVSIETFPVDGAVMDAAQKFEDALKGGDLANICESKIASATTDEEKADWQVIETLNAGKSRKKLREYLGFPDEADAQLADKMTDLKVNGETTEDKGSGEADDGSFFDKAADGEDNFLADLAATKGAKTNEPFHIFSGQESDADKGITQALMLGKFEAALDICLTNDRVSDAFMIAICGGQKCIDKVQAAYLKKKAHGPNYLRLLASIVGKNLWDVVHNADLANWKEVMATLCTFADETEFSDLCEALGDRLEEALSQGGDGDKGTLRRDASFCFLAGSKLEKVVSIWAQELQEKETASLEQADGESGFSVHARSLQDFIEKVTVFRQVVSFDDAGRKATEDWKLAPLYNKYAEYADILASHGQLHVAEKYLDLLPPKFPAAEVAQERVRRATRRAPVTRQSAPVTSRATAHSAYGAVPTPAAPIMAPAAPAMPSANPYAPTGGIMPTPAPANPYAPPASTFAPTSYGSPYGGYAPPVPATAPLAPPPRAGTPSGAAAAAAARNTKQWNDLPEDFSKPPQASRRGTPGAPPVSAPFPNQPGVFSPPPPMGVYGAPKPASPALPPPPKAGEVHRVMSPATAGAVSPGIVRPASAAANKYAAPATATMPPMPPMPGANIAPPPASVPRGPSPYQPPPTSVSSAPTTNRYAPAPGSQTNIPGAMGAGIGGAPPMTQIQRMVAPPPNPYSRGGSAYAPSPVAPTAAGSAYAPSPVQQAQQNAPLPPPPSGPPKKAPTGPPPSGPPRNRSATPVAEPSNSRPSSVAGNRIGTPVQAGNKHPSGDRTHIPATAQPIFATLSTDMARVKSRAPASFAQQVNDTEKRLNILFDALNNEAVAPGTVQELVEIAQAVQSRDMDGAARLVAEMIKGDGGAGGLWMVGVKRLVAMSKATPL